MEEVDLRAFFRMLRRQMWVIAGVAFLTIVLAMTYTLHVVKREYTASSSLLYSDSSTGSTLSSIASSLGLPITLRSAGPAAWFETILTSRRLARKMVDKYDLVKVLDAKGPGHAAKLLSERIIITPNNEAKAILVSVKLPGTPIHMPGRGIDADRAQLCSSIANDLVAELDMWLKTTDYQSSSSQRKFIEEQLAEVLRDINMTRQELVQTFQRTGVFAPDEQGEKWLAALADLESNIASTEAQLSAVGVSAAAGASKQQDKRLASLAAESDAKSAQHITDLRKQISDLQVQVRREKEVNHKTDEHPDVAQLRESVDELQAKLDAELSIANQARRLQEKQLNEQLELGRARWAGVQSKLSALPAQGLEVEELKHRLETGSGMVDMLAKQLLMARIGEQQETQNFTVLDAAEPPRGAGSPSLVLSLAVAIAVGFMLGLFAAGVRHFTSSTPTANCSDTTGAAA